MGSSRCVAGRDPSTAAVGPAGGREQGGAGGSTAGPLPITSGSPGHPGTPAGAVERLEAERAALGRSDVPFDIELFAASDAADRETVRRFADAGATWWLETLHPVSDSMDRMLARIEAGPPR
jgi:hypothetical protein